MEHIKRLGLRVFIWALLSASIQNPNVMRDEVTDVFIDESTTGARMGCGDMAPCGMENYRLEKQDWSREEYFDCVKTKGAYQEFRGLPNQWWVAHPSDGVLDIVWLLPKNLEVEFVQYIFDKAIYDYDNYCPSGTEKGTVYRVLFVDGTLWKNLIEKYHEKTGVVSTGIMLLATKTQDKEFLEYITKELRGEKIGVVTKLLLESDSSYEQEVSKFFCFMGCLFGVVTKLLLESDSSDKQEYIDWFMRSYFCTISSDKQEYIDRFMRSYFCTMGFFLIGLVYDGYFYRFGEWPVPLPLVEWPPAAG